MSLQTPMAASLSDEQFGAFVDVDFSKDAQVVGRMCGATHRVISYGSLAGVPRYGDVFPVHPSGQWKGMIEAKNAAGGCLEPLVPWVYDQDGEPSCVSNAELLADLIKQNELFGRDKVVVLSPISLYMRCGTRGSGSSLDKNQYEMSEIGALPLRGHPNSAPYKHTMPANGYGTKYEEGWKDTAGIFKFAEFADIGGLAEFVSAILNGHPVVYARSGHCILAVGLVYRNGALYIVYCNSWGKWGAVLSEYFAYGAGFDSQRTIEGCARGSMALLNVQLPVPLPQPVESVPVVAL